MDAPRLERIILTTGGTGGHIFPALAVAEELRRQYPTALLVFMGGRYGPEADLAAKAGLDFIGLPVRGVMGRGGRGFFAAFGMLLAVLKAFGAIRKIRPDAVVGFGGYAAFAGVLAARLAGRPTAIHEQNSYPGMANRLLGRIADRVFLSMPDASMAFDVRKSLLTGNPVRADIVELYEKRRAEGERPREERPRRLLVMGGSQGARAINDAMLAIAGRLQENGIEIRHQSGAADYERVRAAYQAAGIENLRLEPFISDMGRAYAWADLALCRAGASSLAEISAAGLPSVLVPFPQAAQDHQRHNARFPESEGAALVIEQDEFAGAKAVVLARLIEGLAADRERLALMARRALSLARPYAALEIVEALRDLTMRKKSGAGTGLRR